MPRALRAIPLPSDAMLKNAEVLGDLLAALREVGSEHVVVGGLAAGYHGRVRATIDVDLLVPKRRLKRLGAAMRPRGYSIRELPDMTRVYSKGEEDAESVADLVALESNPTLRAAAKAKEHASLLGHRVEIVQRGAFVALKFHAALSQARNLADRYQGVVDIGRVLARAFDANDRALALTIADTIYPGARDDLAAMIDDLAAGRPVKL
jgi:hypothetical protein